MPCCRLRRLPVLEERGTFVRERRRVSTIVGGRNGPTTCRLCQIALEPSSCAKAGTTAMVASRIAPETAIEVPNILGGWKSGCSVEEREGESAEHPQCSSVCFKSSDKYLRSGISCRLGRIASGWGRAGRLGREGLRTSRNKGCCMN